MKTEIAISKNKNMVKWKHVNEIRCIILNWRIDMKIRKLEKAYFRPQNNIKSEWRKSVPFLIILQRKKKKLSLDSVLAETFYGIFSQYFDIFSEDVIKICQQIWLISAFFFWHCIMEPPKSHQLGTNPNILNFQNLTSVASI